MGCQQPQRTLAQELTWREETVNQELTRAVEGLMPQALDDLAALVAMRSVADERVEDPEELAKAARWVVNACDELGFASRLAPTPDGTDTVIAHYEGPKGTPKVLLYSHYDVQPAPTRGWETDPWVLSQKGDRFYGRGAADCKGNIVAHLTALRALRQTQGSYPCSITMVVEGSEEQGTAGLERYVEANPEEFSADVMIIGDVGNIDVGIPTLTVALRGMVSLIVTVSTTATQLHSGAFGGAVPDAATALISILASMHDDRGNVTIDGLDNAATWMGGAYEESRFVRDAGLLDGVERIGSGTVADQLWARPALTVIGVDLPGVEGAVPALQPSARAQISLRIPPGVDPEHARSVLVDHVRNAAPWGVQVECEPAGMGSPYAANTDSHAFRVLQQAMEDAFGHPAQTSGQGGSIPLTAALFQAHPDAEIVMIGVADPACRMHAENESVHPGEIQGMALAEALFLQNLHKR